MSETPTGKTDKELRIYLKKRLFGFEKGEINIETSEIDQLLHWIERLEYSPPLPPIGSAKEYLKLTDLVPSYEKDSVVWNVDFDRLCKVLESFATAHQPPISEEEIDTLACAKYPPEDDPRSSGAGYQDGKRMGYRKGYADCQDSGGSPPTITEITDEEIDKIW